MKRIEELKTLSPEDKRILREAKEIICRFLPDAEILLYGSVARGTGQPESDYDVLALLASDLSNQQKDAVRGAVYDLELAHNVVISLIFYTRDEWDSPLVTATPYRKNLAREGVLL